MDKKFNNNGINETKEYIQKYLIPIIKNSNEMLEGNLFFYHHQKDFTKYRSDNLVKVRNLFNLLKNYNLKNAMEIGFNSGFSALLMLISDPLIKVTCYDIASHSYTKPCFEQIKKTFGNRINLIFGDSRETLPKSNDKFDLIHIDGGHRPDIVVQDIKNCYNHSKINTIFVFDDYNFLKKLWDRYVKKFSLVNVESSFLEKTIFQDIKIRIN